MAFKEAITWLGALDHATRCRAEAERRPMRAYVTGGPVTTREPTQCVRATASRHAVRASSMARSTRAARRPLRMHRR